MSELPTDGICFKDSQGRPRIAIQVDEKSGVPYLQLIDAKGRPRLELTLGDDGNPGLRMFSENGLQAFSVGVSEDLCGAGADFFATDGSHGVSFSITKDGVDFHMGGRPPTKT